VKGLIIGLAIGPARGTAVPVGAGEQDQRHALIYSAALRAAVQATFANQALGNPLTRHPGTIAGQLEALRSEFFGIEGKLATLCRADGTAC
jgi:hypothetical protein